METIQTNEHGIEELRKAQASGKWFAPSLFVTYYGPWGFKFEAECSKYNADGTHEHDSFNIDGPTKRYVSGKIEPKFVCYGCGKPLKKTTSLFCNRTCRVAYVNRTCVTLSKGEMYEATKDLFWKAWNEKHPNEKLSILKCMSTYGL